jgi:hypothetical protein
VEVLLVCASERPLRRQCGAAEASVEVARTKMGRMASIVIGLNQLHSRPEDSDVRGDRDVVDPRRTNLSLYS